MAQLGRWMGALLGGDDALLGGDDAHLVPPITGTDPSRVDTLGGVVTQVMQLVNAILNGTDAQVNTRISLVTVGWARADLLLYPGVVAVITWTFRTSETRQGCCCMILLVNTS